MKDKKIVKKWWFWVIVVIIVLGAIGSLNQNDSNKPTTTSNPQKTTDSETNTDTLPKLIADDYINKEGLVVYKELKAKGYEIEARFDNQALTDINGKASDLFEHLDPNNPDDKQSVDAFIVGKLAQDGDKVALTITKTSN